MKWFCRIEKGHILCALLILIGISAYVWESVISITFALRQTVDDVGRTVSPGQMVTLVLATLTLSGMTGWLWRSGSRFDRWVATLLFIASTVPLAYLFSNSVAFNYGQTEGKTRLANALNQQARDIAAEQMRLAAEQRKAQQEWVHRTYEQMARSRSKDDRKQAGTLLAEQSKDILGTPLPVVVPQLADVLPDPKAAAFGRWLGLDGETFRWLDGVMLSGILKLIEWLFPMLGMAYWPRASRDDATVATPIQPTQPAAPILPQPVRTTDSEERQAGELGLVSEWLSIGAIHVPGDEHRRVLAADAYDAFRSWCQKAKHAGRVITITSFGNRMKELGVEKTKVNGKNVHYLGLSLRAREAAPGMPKLTVVSHHRAAPAA